MSSIENKKNQIIEEFSFFDEWMEKYEYIIDLGKKLDAFPENEKVDSNLIKGCQSRVWLTYKVEENRIYFKADSDALITKGIVSLLVSVYSGEKAKDISMDSFDFLDKIGLKESLSPTRRNGLLSMIERIKLIAQNNKDE